jgi:DNA polymerase III gamma/tau subunit
VKTLEKIQKEAARDNWSHAYLLIGDGDTELSEIIEFLKASKKVLLADIVEVLPDETLGKKKEIKIEQIRNFVREISLSAHGPCRLGIIHGADLLNISSANAMLKTLEEPAKNVILVLTAKTGRIMPTIRSRCRIFRFGSDVPKEHLVAYAEIEKESLAKSFKRIEEVVAENQVTEYLDTIVDALRIQMVEKNDERLAKLIILAEEMRKRIKGNANPKLALENLIIEMRNK